MHTLKKKNNLKSHLKTTALQSLTEEMDALRCIQVALIQYQCIKSICP